MLRTLHWYILREMGRTTLLTALGLTLVLATGGSVVNILDLDQISADQLAQIMAILLPVSATIALPVAALFGAAAAYGRLAADNEFQACSASGINVQRLIWPAAWIAALAALSTFFLVNYYIPNRIQKLDDLLRADPARLVLQALNNPRRLLLTQNVKAYADAVEPAVDANGAPVVRLLGAAIIKLDEDRWNTYGTAQTIDVRFTQTGLWAEVDGGTMWDTEKGAFGEGHLVLGHERIPQLTSIRHRLNWLNLNELFRARTHPTEIPAVADGLAKLRQTIAVELAYRTLVEAYRSDGRFVIHDGERTLEVSAKSGTTAEDSLQPSFEDVQLTIREGNRKDSAQAGMLVISGEPHEDSADVDLTLKLSERVMWTSSANLGQKVAKNSDLVGPIRVTTSGTDAFSDARLLNREQPLNIAKNVDDQRIKLLKGVLSAVRGITGVVHSRLAFSGSVLVLVVLAAALGIIFRGGHVLVAFGISFVPALFVTVMIIMGRQLSQNSNMEPAGLGVIWLSIVLVGILDVVVLGKVLRR